MKNAVCTFMEHIIDYAGLFPPASLPLKTAISNYAAYRISDDAWMLGRFIIPSSRLGELNSYVPLFSKEVPLTISTLGRKSDNWTDGLKGLREDLGEIANFCNLHGNAVEIGVFELPLPSVPADRECLGRIAAETSERGLQTFCEVTVPLNADWELHMMETLDAIADHNSTGGSALGVKLRMGGVTADAFPTPAQVAAVLIGCRDRGIAIKFTAGLHHPIRMFRSEVNTRMHGFINVFTAGMLAHVHHLDISTTAEILADEESNSFSFDNKGLSWRNHSLSDQEMKRLRRTVLCTYGSCSFDEPREGLRMLNIL